LISVWEDLETGEIYMGMPQFDNEFGYVLILTPILGYVIEVIIQN
jgi:hypothetical protein